MVTKKKTKKAEREEQIEVWVAALKETLADAIAEAKREAIQYAEGRYGDFANLPEALQEEILEEARVKVVGVLTEAAKRFVTENEELYKSLLKGEKYPKKWMLKDGQISSNLKKYPAIVTILNYADNQRSDPRDEWTKEVLNGVAYEVPSKKEPGKIDKRPYSVFLVDVKFLDGLQKKLKKSQRYVQRFIQDLTKLGIFKKLDDAGKVDQAYLYANGYYVDRLGTLQWTPFLSEARHKDALRNFRPSW
jgi:hypothetical protein